MSRRRSSLAHLTALHVPPPELVRLAAAAGFDAVGPVRLTPSRDGTGHPMLGAHATMRRLTVDALRDSGLGVIDVEVVRLRPDTDLVEVDPLLEAGAELGARYLLCTVEDPDPERAAAVWSELCGRAAPYGLTCMLEFMVFSAVRTAAAAGALVEQAASFGGPSGGVLVDALHLQRSGGSAADVRALDPALIPYLQLCDAASREPATDPAAAAREAGSERLAPGDGCLPLGDLLDAVPPGAAVSLEVPNPRARRDAEGWIRHVGASAHRCLGVPA